MTKILCVGDLHCGHITGLNPPRYTNVIDDPKLRAAVHATSAWFHKELEEQGPYDICILNGDAIEGLASRAKGRHVFTTDMHKQVDMALEVVSKWPVKAWGVVRGTPYHTGTDTDYEDLIAKELNAPISPLGSNVLNLEEEGVRMNFRHHAGRSTVPHGRATALSKEQLWDELVSEAGADAHIVLRSHVHYFLDVYDGVHRAVSLPAVQGWSDFGSKRCLGYVDQGFYTITCKDGGYSTCPTTRRVMKKKSDYISLSQSQS